MKDTRPLVSRRALLRAALLGVGGSSAFMAYADRSSYRLQVERHTLRLPRWDADGFRVVLLSDTHVNSDTAMRRGRRAAEIAVEEKPDLIVFAGDAINTSQAYGLEHIARSFEPLREAKCPCVGVLGNHDYWVQQPAKVVEAVRNSPVRLLQNEIFECDGVTVAGVDDALVGRMRPAFLRERPRSKSTLVLLHEPDFVRELPLDASLQLSGHSHGGQMCLPMGVAVHTPVGARDYIAGFYPSAPVPLYVSRGVGTIGPDLRTFCPPEVSVLTLRSAS
ncbi:MAG: metallophosphoesterase [Fimbriimonadaceae bacterium]|nr:metallophosphoesterase [Fimbriimonadaceae bacterium]